MPFKFRIKIDKIVLDGNGKFSPTMIEKFERFVRNCAREWVRAVIVRIPVWSGMSRGAIKYAKGRSGDSAGKFLGTYLRIAIPIGPRRTADDGRLETKRGRTPDLGGRQSRYTFSYDETNHKFRFTFQSDVPQLIYNDFYANQEGAPPGSQGAGMWNRPWLALQMGQKAFNDYAITRAKYELKNLINFRFESVRSPKPGD